MLTTISNRPNLFSGMQVLKFFPVSLSVLILSSCYTMLYPPQTLPRTVTTVVSEPAMVSTIGGTGTYGWDPYWEPVLPFTSYHYGYGATYYSPYNYYDYHHPHYAPIYVVSETRDPAPARNFDRDEKQGGSRTRDRIGSTSAGSPGNKGNSPGQSSSMSTAVSGSAIPITKNPVIPPPMIKPAEKRNSKENKLVPIKSSVTNTRKSKVVTPRTVKQQPAKQQPVKKQESVEQKDSPKPAKRTRTRK